MKKYIALMIGIWLVVMIIAFFIVQQLTKPLIDGSFAHGLGSFWHQVQLGASGK